MTKITGYRIFRVDSKNIAIQRHLPDGNWRTISYHGHNINSLARGLQELVMTNYTPDNDNILKSLKKLELEQARMTEQILKICQNFVKAE